MTILSIVLSVVGAVVAWFAFGPTWLPLVVVGTAAALAFVQTIGALRANNWGHWSLRALVFALVVLIALPTIERYRAQAQGAVPVTVAGGELTLPPAGSPAANAEALPAISNDPPPPTTIEQSDAVRRTSNLAKAVSRTRFDLDARIASLGPGTDPSFMFVRDSIGFDSYPGVLRGDRGALLAQAGNAWDRALLLSTLLRAKGIPTRIATGRLDDDSARRLFDRLFVPRAPAAGESAAVAAASPSEFARRLKTRAARDMVIVRTALQQNAPADSGVTRETILEELSHHAWVQAEIRGAWRDLDPSLPTSEPGQALTAAVDTFDEIPEERWQRVTIRVIAESLADGQLDQAVRLEWTSRAADVLGKKMFLLHVPSGQGAGGRLARMAGEQWRPALWLDGTVEVGEAIQFGSAAGANSAGNFFFGDSPATLVAEWLEIDFDLANGSRETTRRALFNRASDALRAGDLKAEALAPIPTLDAGPIPALALHNIWFTAGGHNLAAYADSLAEISQRLDSLPAEPEPEDQLRAIAAGNFPFLVWSEHLILPSVNDAAGVRVYADSPRAFIFSIGPSSKGPGGIDGTYDLHRDRVRAIARDDSVMPAAVERKIWFGLLEGALEHELTAAEVGDAQGRAADLLTTSALAGTQGAALVREGTTDQVQALAGDPSRADRMLAAVARGSALIVPRPASGQPARGWWEIAANGDTKAVIDGDLGGSSYAIGKGLPGGRVPRLPRLPGPRPTPGGGASQEYTNLLTLIALSVIIAFEIIGFTIHLRAVMRGLTVLESMDRDFGG